MFIGGGSGGTAGGVKVTTAAVLVAVLIAEVRGDDELLVAGRRIPGRIVRQSMAVFMMAFILIAGSIMGLQMLLPQFNSHQITFETISAFATVGLTTGITPDLPEFARVWLVVLMYAGRIGCRRPSCPHQPTPLFIPRRKAFHWLSCHSTTLNNPSSSLALADLAWRWVRN